jgi:sortase A
MVDGTILATPTSPPPAEQAPLSFGDKVRFVLRGIGQTLITLGLVVLLFVVYEVWITNIFAAREQAKVYNALKNEWAQGKDPLLPLPGDKTATIPIGTGIGVLYIPRLGRDYHFAIVQGNTVPDDSDLEKGPAHYRDTQLPGQKGNFAIAGHRVGKGEPFLNIDKLKSGDSIIVETKSWWYVYRVLGTPPGENPETVRASFNESGTQVSLPGREIVDPSDGNVLLPVPDHPDIPLAAATSRLMTFTTCHPKFTASHRMIVYSKLVKKVANNPLLIHNGQMPASVQALYAEVKA